MKLTVYQYALLRFKEIGLTPEKEFKFYSSRRWKFDFCFPQIMVAVEIEGAVYANGRHTRGSGFIKDIDKYNTAATNGWKVLRAATNEQVDQIIMFVLLEINKQ